VLRHEPSFERLRDQVIGIAAALEEKATIPMVRDQLARIQEIQDEEWWRDVTTPMLEVVRLRLRSLVRFIDRHQRRPIFTDFEDEMGPEARIHLPGFGASADFEKFRDKARAFLRGHLDHVSIRKLRSNRALTASDLSELQRMLAESGVGGAEQIASAAQESDGLGVFVRGLVGLDREAAKTALSGFTASQTLTANQIEFVNMVVDHLTEHGVMPAARLYESPFTDLAPHGPDGLFAPAQVTALIETLDGIRATAKAA
jgi:type I restriction enzyme R subunit